jgi:hypothetical protein
VKSRIAGTGGIGQKNALILYNERQKVAVDAKTKVVQISPQCDTLDSR